MSDEESQSSGSNSSRGASTYRIPSSLVKPPPALELGADKAQNWRVFKKRWNNFELLSGFDRVPRDIQVAMLENCLGIEALKKHESHSYETAVDTRTVAQILKRMEHICIGEINETFERFRFNSRMQRDGEDFDSFLSDLLAMIKTCNYCDTCQNSIVRDRIVLGIRDKDTQTELLKLRQLETNRCVDICKAAEDANAQKSDLYENVHKIRSRETNMKMKRAMSGKCRYCGQKHVFRKEECPAWGKLCDHCKKRNHFAVVCAMKKKQKEKEQKVHNIDDTDSDTSSGDDDWINTVGAQNSKDIKCKMLVDGQEVIFQIDTGASVNMLPKKFAHEIGLQPNHSILKMWDGTTFTPKNKCRKSLKNPRTKKKYSVEFVVFEDDCQPLLGLKASQAMGLITVEEQQFERVATVMKDAHSKVFRPGLGSLPGVQKLHVRSDMQPTIMANRRVPIAVRPKLKAELKRMTDLGVITPVEEPTPWVSQMVIVEKKSGALRICIDPHELNKALQRERYTMPILDDTLHEMRHSRIFTKADLSSGYWHITLDEESSKLTTFQTCFGRFRWKRLPFGLSVSAEIFQKRLLDTFSDIPGIVCIADDVIIYGRDLAEHDKRLHKFLHRCSEVGIKLNKEKYEVVKKSVTFMGHTISSAGLESDPQKVAAITAMPRPENVEDLRRFGGIVNYLARFVPNLASVMHPLHNLLKKDVTWMWSTAQENAFQEIKTLIATAPVLAIYDPTKELTVENDACEYGIGSALLQDGRPVAFASRTLSGAERRYAQIEKEMLAAVYGLEKFHHYTFGREVRVVTDHKPLEAISRKPLSKAPRRLQSLILRAKNYEHAIEYKSGKQIPIADALSRAPVDKPEETEITTVNSIMLSPIRASCLERVRQATAEDKTLVELERVITTGWSDDKSKLAACVLPYHSYRDELSIQDGVIYRGERVVIPASLRRELKQKMHAGHLGINSCLRQAREIVFWPGMSGEIRHYVEACGVCATYADKQPAEPLVMLETPKLQWQRVGTDLFSWAGKEHLVTVDYNSGFFEVDTLPNTESGTVIMALKAHFARHGIPVSVVSDNGPQYTSASFKDFTKQWGFDHQTSSPGNSQANGAAEAAVKIIKRIFRKSNAAGEDPYIGLLNARNTPTEGMSTSPVQRLMGRRTRTLIPISDNLLKPADTRLMGEERTKKDLKKRHAAERHIKRKNYNLLQQGDNVRVQPIDNKKEWKQAVVTKRLNNRSYEVEANGKQYRRNRRHLRAKEKSTHTMMSSPRHNHVPLEADANRPQSPVTTEPTMPQPESDIESTEAELVLQPKDETTLPNKVEKRTRSGRVVKNVVRMDL